MKYRLYATSLVTHTKEVEADSAEQAEQKGFFSEETGWEEIGEADWQLDRCEALE